MTLALILLVVLLAGGAMLYLHDRFTHGEEKAPVREPEQQCCGMHITCEKDWLLASVSEKIEYYDDEELDRYAGIEPDAYTEEQAGTRGKKNRNARKREKQPKNIDVEVKSGDNLSKIAKRSGVSVEELRKANPKLKGDMLHPGDKLNIPTKGKAAKQSKKNRKKGKRR